MTRHIFSGILVGVGAFLLCAQFVRFLPDVRCADGWRSPSIGRQGACSGHGGVRGNGAGFVLVFAVGVGVVAGKGVARRLAPRVETYQSIVDVLAEAISAGVRVSFSYRKRPSSVAELRTIWPREFQRIARPRTGGSTLCVLGFCEKRRADRVFAVERMSAVRICGGSG